MTNTKSAVKSKGTRPKPNFKGLAKKYKELYRKAFMDFEDVRDRYDDAQAERNKYMREAKELREENGMLRELCEIRAQDFILSHNLLLNAEEKNQTLQLLIGTYRRDVEDLNKQLEAKVEAVYPEFMQDYERMRKELDSVVIDVVTDFVNRLRNHRVQREGITFKVVSLDSIDECATAIIKEAAGDDE